MGCYRCNDRCCRGRRRSVFFLCAKEDAGVSVSGRDRIGCCSACSGDPRFDGSHVGPMMCENECVRSQWVGMYACMHACMYVRMHALMHVCVARMH